MNNCSVWTTALALAAISYARNARVVKDDFLPAEGPWALVLRCWRTILMWIELRLGKVLRPDLR
jgi:hypothetical protein